MYTEITKREILFSIIIISVMLLVGFLISDNINDSVMDANQEYNTALQINNDSDLFKYGMKTNIGNAFVYGDLKAVDTVTFDEIGGQYSYVKKVKERYTQHTRVVTETYYVNGKAKTRTKTETYWTWDKVDSWKKHSEKIKFLGVEFDYGTINFPPDYHIKTIKESSRIRYKYYGAPIESIGTLYAKLGDNTIDKTHFYRNHTIEETLDNLKTNWQVPVFWVFWIILMIAAVIVFYYIDNRWLEDRY